MKRYCVTIDTEPDCDIHWRRSDPSTFESVLYGIPNILRPLWNKYDIKPVYFITDEVALNEECCRVLAQEVEFGAEIGTHLHNGRGYPCYAYDTKTEKIKIKTLTDLIERNMGTRPISYRAGRFGADFDTLRILAELGYQVDSSLTPGIDWTYKGGPNHASAAKQPYFDIDILEVPITIGGKRFPLNKWWCYRWFRPSITSYCGMKKLVDTFTKSDTVNIVRITGSIYW